MLYYDPTHVAGTVDRGPVVESLTISEPQAEGEIVEAITITRIGEADSVGDA